jgi:hypothetical protein
VFPTVLPVAWRVPNGLEDIEMTQNTASRRSILRTIGSNLLLDAGLFLTFLVVYEEKATGVTIHEWLGVGIVAVIVAHILLHWKWIVGMTRGLFHRLKAMPRLNYLLDIVVFVGFTTIIFSGLMMSRSVLPFFGITASSSYFWKWLHSTSTEITVWLVALHVALNWRWIVNTVRHRTIEPVAVRLGVRRTASPSR